ncbi:hypothetical protein [Zavarzinella formosa]|uniref:hypothetical protein n=1 Tax=Zavarzinella formosa TaxID=360055 RepID=UPI00037F5B7D|nr:hypothetical protein [Zavarzinella formosa]
MDRLLPYQSPDGNDRGNSRSPREAGPSSRATEPIPASSFWKDISSATDGKPADAARDEFPSDWLKRLVGYHCHLLAGPGGLPGEREDLEQELLLKIFLSAHRFDSSRGPQGCS